jgi:hypothetical protein
VQRRTTKEPQRSSQSRKSTHFLLFLDHLPAYTPAPHRSPFPPQATPITAGVAALTRQFFTDGFYPGGKADAASGFAPSAALLKSALINSASALSDAAFFSYYYGPSGVPPLPQLRGEGGFGVPSLLRGLSFSSVGPDTRAAGQLPTLLLPGLTFRAADPARAASPAPASDGVDPVVDDGGVIVYCVDTRVPPSGALGAGGAIPLSITLVWTDPAGSPAASIALVNDLDLEVTPPDSATAYYGNTDPAISAKLQRADHLNNVEKLTFFGPNSTLDFVSGARIGSPWKVVVRGFAVPFGPQPYSLVVTGPGISLSSPTGSCSGSPSPVNPDDNNNAATKAQVSALTAGVATLGTIVVVGAIGALAFCARGRSHFGKSSGTASFTQNPAFDAADSYEGGTVVFRASSPSPTSVSVPASNSAMQPLAFVKDYGTSSSRADRAKPGMYRPM